MYLNSTNKLLHRRAVFIFKIYIEFIDFVILHIKFLTVAIIRNCKCFFFYLGPICANVRDTAVFYALLAGPHPDFIPGSLQPRIKLPDFSGDLKGMKVGIDRRYFKVRF